MKRVALYLRVSTAKQDTDNQRRELEAVAERSGWEGRPYLRGRRHFRSKGRDKRPGLDTMMRAVNAKRFDMVAAWSGRPVRPIADGSARYFARSAGQRR